LNKFFDSHGVPFAGNDGKILPLHKRIIPALDVFFFNRSAAEHRVHLTAFGARLAWLFFGFILVLAVVLAIIGGR